MRWFLGLGMALAFVVTTAACGGSDATIKKGTTAVGGTPTVVIPTTAPFTPTVPPTSTPTPPTVEVAYFHYESSFDGFRFVAIVRNPAAKAVSGLKLRWDAFDSSGASVGSLESTHPDIAAGGTYDYVGGAGIGLTGKPVAVKVTVTDPGRLVDNAQPPFKVEDVQMAADNFTPGSYTVSAAVTTGSTPIARTDLKLSVVLRDAAGKIVGAGFSTADSAPQTIDPGTKVRIQVPLISTSATPTSAEAVASQVVR
jgi:hypothetical protein